MTPTNNRIALRHNVIDQPQDRPLARAENVGGENQHLDVANRNGGAEDAHELPTVVLNGNHPMRFYAAAMVHEHRAPMAEQENLAQRLRLRVVHAHQVAQDDRPSE